MKTFQVELKDLYPASDLFTAATVFYENGDLCAQPVRDEFGREWSLKDLSIYDIQLIQKHLMLNLIADANLEACGYSDDISEEFDRAEERMSIYLERGAV